MTTRLVASSSPSACRNHRLPGSTVARLFFFADAFEVRIEHPDLLQRGVSASAGCRIEHHDLLILVGERRPLRQSFAVGIAGGGEVPSCIAERRAIGLLEHGAATTPFLRFGDRVRISAIEQAGPAPFGAIDQRVVKSRGGDAPAANGGG
jgi:hypothetical protein